jgi:hypothetical protein
VPEIVRHASQVIAKMTSDGKADDRVTGLRAL